MVLTQELIAQNKIHAKNFGAIAPVIYTNTPCIVQTIKVLWKQNVLFNSQVYSFSKRNKISVNNLLRQQSLDTKDMINFKSIVPIQKFHSSRKKPRNVLIKTLKTIYLQRISINCRKKKQKAGSKNVKNTTICQVLLCDLKTMNG